uniref:Uncharacterized protein n=1 Tax=Propithecus coquereli TaxID=379532 RepID=A0A2K6FNA8_PROCO
TQSREPSGSRAAERRRGWRRRGVPTPSGDPARGAGRPAARGGAGGTAGQQRPLQVPGASADPTLKVEPSGSAARSPRSTRCESPSRSGPAAPSGRSPLIPAAISWIPRPHYLQDVVRGRPASDFDSRD